MLGDLLPRMPKSFGRLVEPFAGGAALSFRVRPAEAVLGDINADLVELYQEVARDPSGLHARASELFERHAVDREATYYGGRAAWNDRRRDWDPQRRAACFLYLNRTCFNGLYRVNRAGAFNVPIGRPSSSREAHCPTLPQLIAAGEVLGRSILRCSDYVETIALAERGDLVYLDPPYLPLLRREAGDAKAGKAASFAAYTSDGFGERDHEELAMHARALVERGVHVMASNADVPLARVLYDGFRLSAVSSSRPISARAQGRARVGELILTSYPSGSLDSDSDSGSGSGSNTVEAPAGMEAA